MSHISHMAPFRSERAVSLVHRLALPFGGETTGVEDTRHSDDPGAPDGRWEALRKIRYRLASKRSRFAVLTARR
jgi:hypothetical protein